jgi:hypothetical protein
MTEYKDNSVHQSGVVQKVSNILKPTLHDNDFLQSFVRIGLNEVSKVNNGSSAEEKYFKR